MKEKHTVATGAVCTPELFEFPAVKKRVLQASFTGGEVTSDGGIALLCQVDCRLGLTKELARRLPDPRSHRRSDHPLPSLVHQRIYGLAQGYEDLNDHDTMRHDVAWQTAVEREVPLASSHTLCRLENRADRQVAWATHQVLVEQFIRSFAQTPTAWIFDFDAPMTGCMGSRSGASSTVTMAITASYPCMCSVETNSWWPT